jgi:hypothetical protein
MDDIHALSPFMFLDVRSGEGRKIRSLMLVLDGNIPRFPWEPSTTTLTYRLESTTEGFGVLPGRTPHSVPTTMSMWRAGSGASATPIFARPGEHQGALGC